MLKKIKSNLTAKIIILTMFLLMLVCFITYAFIAFFIPRSYSLRLQNDIDEQAQELVSELKNVNFDDSSYMLIEFMQRNSVIAYVYFEDLNYTGRPAEAFDYANDVLAEGTYDTELSSEDDTDFVDESLFPEIDTNLYDESQESELDTSFFSESLAADTEAATAESEFSSEVDTEIDTSPNDLGPVDENGKLLDLSNSSNVVYEIYFADSDTKYLLSIIGNEQAVNQALEALDLLLPWLILVIIVISLIAAVIYALYITRPILTISRTARIMEQLDFEARCPEGRSDEIGTLSDSLNHMSAKLGSTLSELQEANAALIDDIERERKLERQRMDFFAAVSHELKTPVTILKGQLEGMIRKIGIYQDRDKYLARCYDTVGNMEELVAEILLVSRIESDNLVVVREPLNLKVLLLDSLSTLKPLLTQKDFQLGTEQLCDAEISGDASQLKKVVNNLLLNAIQYSPPGMLIRLASGSDDDDAFFSIENTGVQIDPEDLEKLFQPFFRLEKSRNRNTGGSGLGLYLVKKIITSHDGRCQMENTSNGVKVTVFLQLHEKHK